MSWHFSRALAEDCLRLLSMAGKQSALSNWIGTADAFSYSDRMTDYSVHSRFGMTFVPLTAERGAGSLMLYLEASLARPTAALHLGETSPTTFGRKCGESWQMSLPGTYSPRTSASERSTAQPMTAKRWVTKPAVFPLARKTWAVTTFGSGIGYLHTPTCTANYAAPSMQKWPCAQSFTRVFGSPSPTNHEFLMGWPIGWSDLSPLETVKFQQWQQQHSDC